MAIAVNPEVSGGGSGDVVGPASSIDGEIALFDGTTGALLKGGGLSLTSQLVRKRIMRPYFEAYRAAMMALYPPVANTGTVVYIDPTVTGPGTGTFADPYKDVPVLTNNYTYLFKERTRTASAARLTGISVTGVVFGTYASLDGARVFQQERLATIDGNTYFRCAIRWQGTSGTFALSGIRIVGGYNASGAVQGFQSITAPAASTITVEYCVVESFGSYQLVTGQTNNQAITVSGARLVARFNRICVDGDGLDTSPAAGAGYEFICNDITTPSSLAAGGPDCLQVTRTSTNAVGKQIIVGNWLNQAASTKQALIVAGGTPQATGEETLFARNFCFGTDIVAHPGLTPFNVMGVAYNNNTTSVQIVVGNYFDQFNGWASVPSNSLLAYNIGVLEHTSTTTWLTGFEAASGGTGALIANNTAIGVNRTVVYDGTSVGFYGANGANATFVNNVCVNMEMKLGTGNVESYSLFQGSSPTDGSNAAKALGTGSSVVTDVMLDVVGRPLDGSPAFAPSSSVTFNSTLLRHPDIFGQTPWDTLSTFGAAQGWGGNGT
jgi:hypothetical protein